MSPSTVTPSAFDSYYALVPYIGDGLSDMMSFPDTVNAASPTMTFSQQITRTDSLGTITFKATLSLTCPSNMTSFPVQHQKRSPPSTSNRRTHRATTSNRRTHRATRHRPTRNRTSYSSRRPPTSSYRSSRRDAPHKSGEDRTLAEYRQQAERGLRQLTEKFRNLESGYSVSQDDSQAIQDHLNFIKGDVHDLSSIERDDRRSLCHRLDDIATISEKYTGDTQIAWITHGVKNAVKNMSGLHVPEALSRTEHMMADARRHLKNTLDHVRNAGVAPAIRNELKGMISSCPTFGGSMPDGEKVSSMLHTLREKQRTPPYDSQISDRRHQRRAPLMTEAIRQLEAASTILTEVATLRTGTSGRSRMLGQTSSDSLAKRYNKKSRAAPPTSRRSSRQGNYSSIPESDLQPSVPSSSQTLIPHSQATAATPTGYGDTTGNGTYDSRF